jgi:hypothetical protein
MNECAAGLGRTRSPFALDVSDLDLRVATSLLWRFIFLRRLLRLQRREQILKVLL